MDETLGIADVAHDRYVCYASGMTNEEKRVIEAARTLVQSHVMDTGHGLELQDAVNALDAAPAPLLTYLVAYALPGSFGGVAVSFRLEPTWDDLRGVIPAGAVPTSACRIGSPRA